MNNQTEIYPDTFIYVPDALQRGTKTILQWEKSLRHVEYTANRKVQNALSLTLEEARALAELAKEAKRVRIELHGAIVLRQSRLIAVGITESGSKPLVKNTKLLNSPDFDQAVIDYKANEAIRQYNSPGAVQQREYEEARRLSTERIVVTNARDAEVIESIKSVASIIEGVLQGIDDRPTQLTKSNWAVRGSAYDPRNANRFIGQKKASARVKVNIVDCTSTGPAPAPAWTDGAEIFIDALLASPPRPADAVGRSISNYYNPAVSSIKQVNLYALKSAIYHEFSHILFSPRVTGPLLSVLRGGAGESWVVDNPRDDSLNLLWTDEQELERAYARVKLHKREGYTHDYAAEGFGHPERARAWNVLEDARIENLFIDKYAGARPYFIKLITGLILKEQITDAQARGVVSSADKQAEQTERNVDSGEIATRFLLTHGRKYLPEKVRDAVRADFVKEFGPDNAALGASIIDRYLYSVDWEQVLDNNKEFWVETDQSVDVRPEVYGAAVVVKEFADFITLLLPKPERPVGPGRGEGGGGDGEPTGSGTDPNPDGGQYVEVEDTGQETVPLPVDERWKKVLGRDESHNKVTKDQPVTPESQENPDSETGDDIITEPSNESGDDDIITEPSPLGPEGQPSPTNESGEDSGEDSGNESGEDSGNESGEDSGPSGDGDKDAECPPNATKSGNQGSGGGSKLSEAEHALLEASKEADRAIAREEKELSRAANAAKTDTTAVLDVPDWLFSVRPVHIEYSKVSNSIAQSLSVLNNSLKAVTEKYTRRGSVQAARVVRGSSHKTWFNRFHKSNLSDALIDIVILVDNSGSTVATLKDADGNNILDEATTARYQEIEEKQRQGSHGADRLKQPVVLYPQERQLVDGFCEAAWAVKHAVESTNSGRVGILVYSSQGDTYWVSKLHESVRPNFYASVDAYGSTDPAQATEEAARTLAKSNAPTKLILNLTDGAFDRSSQGCSTSEIINEALSTIAPDVYHAGVVFKSINNAWDEVNSYAVQAKTNWNDRTLPANEGFLYGSNTLANSNVKFDSTFTCISPEGFAKAAHRIIEACRWKALTGQDSKYIRISKTNEDGE